MLRLEMYLHSSSKTRVWRAGGFFWSRDFSLQNQVKYVKIELKYIESFWRDVEIKTQF